MSHPPPDFASALEDRYRIERELGSGGMATVYLATDVRHGRHVAVKVLRPELASVLGGERFLTEIRTTANLQHPHILGLIDSGQIAGQVFYVMPFVSGETLRDRLRREKQLPVKDAVRIAREVASALDYAHRQGVIHRDIKPENILLQDGQAMVADFGIALAATQAGATRLTESGLSLGTPQYMSPEQTLGERELTPGCDVYALGCVLYEMLTGEPPFTGPTAQSIAAKAMNTDPSPVRSLRRNVSARVAAAVHTALQKLPADRFASAEAFADALGTPEPLGEASLPSQAALDRSPRRKPWRPVVAALALVVAGGAVGWILRGGGLRSPTPTRVSHHSVVLPEGTIFSTYPRPWGVALSPDGGTIVYSAFVAGERERLFVKRPGDVEPQALPGTDGGTHPFFSPDGTWVAFFGDRALKKVSLVSGSVEVITRLDNATGTGSPGTWDDDGTILFGQVWVRTVGIASVSAAGGPVQVLSRPDTARGEQMHLSPQHLHGTETLLYTAVDGSNGNPRVMAKPLRGGASRVVLDKASFARYLGDGRLVYEMGGDLFTARFDVNTLGVSEPRRVLGGVVRYYWGAAWAATRDVLVYRPSASRLLVWVRRDGLATRLTTPAKDYSTPVLSPEGDRVAVVVTEGGRGDVWTSDLRREVMTKVSSDGLTSPLLLWGPNAQRLTVIRSNGAALDLYSLEADGSGGSDLLFRNGTLLWPGDWTRDGRKLVVMQSDSMNSGGDLLILDLADRGTLQPLVRTPASEWGGRLSPDQRWLAYCSNVSGRYELFVTGFPGGGQRRQVSRDGAGEAVWSRDGRELFFRNGNQMLVVTVKAGATFDWDPPRVLFEGNYYQEGGPGIVQYDVSPDGSRFLMIEESALGSPRLNVVQGWDRLVAPGAGTPH